MIDLNNGNSTAITPEGTAGVHLSPDGKSTAVLGPDGKWGIWRLEGDGMHLIPGLRSDYYVTGWSPDGGSLYAFPARSEKTEKVYQVNIASGKMTLWRTQGAQIAPGVTIAGELRLSSDGKAYAYTYFQVLSQAYVVTGLK